MKARFTLAATAALALAACGSSEDASVPIAEDTSSMVIATSEPAVDAALPTTAQAFVDMAAASDMFEIEAGKLAQENGTDQAIKDFGAKMAEDHTQSSSDLKTAAGNVQGVTVNAQLNPMQQSNLAALRSAGDNFDNIYKQQQVAAHEQALSLMQNYAANGDQQALKDFAAKAAPVIETHLTQARDLP